MRCRMSPYHDLRRHARQIDLFAPIAPGGTLKTPAWGSLPAETRQSLTRLMGRLILDRAKADHAPPREETRHDV